MSFEVVTENDYGHQIKILVEEYDPIADLVSIVPLGSFTTREFLIKKPDQTEVTVAADFVTDGSDGWLYADVPLGSGIFNQNGYYTVRARIQNALQRFTSNEFGFTVKPE